MTRVRERKTGLTNGKIMYHNSVVGTGSGYAGIYHCEDTDNVKLLGQYPITPMLIWSLVSDGGVCNSPPGSVPFPLVNYPVGWGPQLGRDSINVTDLMTRALAQTGPLTAKVYLPGEVAELRDVPSMLKHAGDVLHGLVTHPLRTLSSPRQAAAANLAWKYGWAPVLQDLGRLLRLADLVREKQDYLARADARGGIRRRVQLGSTSSSSSGSELLMSTWGHIIQPDYTEKRSSKSWATLRWTLREPAPIGYKPTFNEALRTALGLDPTQIPISAWKAFPWSWAIDWCGNMSDVLITSQNMLFYEPHSLCLMNTSQTARTYAPVSNPYHGFTGYTKTQTWKQRWVDGFPTPSATFRVPYLEPFKLSILSSFAVLKILGSGKL